MHYNADGNDDDYEHVKNKYLSTEPPIFKICAFSIE